jgi:hypothetical protein
MTDERKLELINLLIEDKEWKAIVMIGRELLDFYYPADVFTGESGDRGPKYICALREALARIDESFP